MTGITSTLSITKTAIAAQQAGLNITGQNIANVKIRITAGRAQSSMP